MNIANQGFPNTRSDLNLALVALVSNSSGATAPSTMYAYQWWLDTNTTPTTLKMRNTANDAWISVMFLNQSTNIMSMGSVGFTGATVTSASATALTVGLTGATNPAFTVDSSTASQVAGLKVTGAATGGTVAIVATDSGSNTNLTINSKGTGTIGIGSVSTGAVTITPATTHIGILTVPAGAVSAPSIISTTGTSDTGQWFPAADTIAWSTAGSERMRINSAGNILHGTTSSLGSTAMIEINGQSDHISMRYVSATAGRYVRMVGNSNMDFYISNGGFTNYVYKDYDAQSWAGASDERLKDIIEPITDGLNKVLKLRSVIGKFKTDEEGKRRSFLIAQDVLEVLPEAVQLTNNHVFNREEYVLYYTDVIPLLVSAIKDLKTITEAQAKRIAALENK